VLTFSIVNPSTLTAYCLILAAEAGLPGSMLRLDGSEQYRAKLATGASPGLDGLTVGEERDHLLRDSPGHHLRVLDVN
jgi:hypothetical protein